MKPVASMSAHLFLRLCGIALLLTLAYFGGQGVARISDGSAALLPVSGAASTSWGLGFGEPGAQPLLHQIPRVLFLACADALRHHDGKSHHQRSAQSAEQPRAGGHQSNGSGGVPPQLSHHGGGDVLHDDRRNLRQDRGEAQL